MEDLFPCCASKGIQCGASPFISDSVRYCLSQGVEELMEMLGVLVFLHALLDYIARYIGQVRVRIA